MESKIESDINLVIDFETIRDETLRQMGTAVSDDIKDKMNNQVQIDGTPYAPLAQSTVKQKRSKGYSEPTKRLIATGRLRNAIVMDVDKKVGTVTLLPPLNRAEIAYYQQTGTSRIPKTTFFAISDDAQKKLDEIGFNMAIRIVESVAGK